MRQRITTFFAGALAVALLSSPALFGAAQARIAGQVKDGKGVPLEGVVVTVTTPAITTYKVTLKTDKNGKWQTILNDSTVAYSYKFEKEGYIPQQQTKKVPIGGNETLDVQLLTQEQAIEKGEIKVVVDPYTEAYNGAVELFQAGNLEEALEKAHKAIELGPDKANAFDMGAKVASAKKDFDHVIEWGEKALALDAENAGLYPLLMEAYKAKGNKEKYAEYEKKYVSANPDKPDVLYNQAVDLYNKNDFKNAEPILRQIVEANPTYANAHFLLGMACINLNKIPDMKTHLSEYLKLEPKGKEAATAKEMLEAFK